jgi:hypothetical protein
MLVSRNDRSENVNRGGLINYSRDNLNNISCSMETKNAERVRDLDQRDTGAIAICNWYLLPVARLDGIGSFEQELTIINEIVYSVIAVGDLNIHHESWLRFSNGKITRGRHPKIFVTNLVSDN